MFSLNYFAFFNIQLFHWILLFLAKKGKKNVTQCKDEISPQLSSTTSTTTKHKLKEIWGKKLQIMV